MYLTWLKLMLDRLPAALAGLIGLHIAEEQPTVFQALADSVAQVPSGTRAHAQIEFYLPRGDAFLGLTEEHDRSKPHI